MRITQRILSHNSLAGINQNLNQLSKLQNQMTSGKVINQPSDSPTGTNASMQIRSALGANTQYAANMQDGKTWLDSADSTLQNMLTQVQRVRTLTLQASNQGSMSPSSNQAVAAEINQLHDSLLGLANTQVEGRPLFGGATGGSAAYGPDGTYVGVDSGAGVTRRISDLSTVRVDVSGPTAFGKDDASLFSVVAAIGQTVSANPVDTTKLSSQLSGLDAAISSMTTALTGVGARTNQITTALQANSDQTLALTTQQSSVEDVDMAKTITQLSLQQTSYQAALSVASQAMQPTLVDFLR